MLTRPSTEQKYASLTLITKLCCPGHRYHLTKLRTISGSSARRVTYTCCTADPNRVYNESLSAFLRSGCVISITHVVSRWLHLFVQAKTITRPSLLPGSPRSGQLVSLTVRVFRSLFHLESILAQGSWTRGCHISSSDKSSTLRPIKNCISSHLSIIH